MYFWDTLFFYLFSVVKNINFVYDDNDLVTNCYKKRWSGVKLNILIFRIKSFSCTCTVKTDLV